MRHKLASTVLLLVVATAALPAGAQSSPCTDNALLCPSPANDAACVAVGAYLGSAPFAFSDTAVNKPEGAEHDAVHQFETGARTPPVPPQVPAGLLPDVALHVGAVESWCTSYLFDGQTKSKSCGSGELGEVIFDFNRGDTHIRVRADAITQTTCASAEPGPFPPLIAAHFENLVIEIGGSVIGIPDEQNPNTIYPPDATDNFVAVNEQFIISVPGCASAGGSALRIKSGASNFIIGWSSVVACTP